jgi:hypothetical protein
MSVLHDFRTFCSGKTAEKVHGIEWVFVAALLFFRVFSVSYWLRKHKLPSAHGADRTRRDNFIDGCCLVQTFVLMAASLSFALNSIFLRSVSTFLAGYTLLEIILTLLNIVFVGKFPELQAPPASIERSIILLFLNLVQIVLIFGIFYAYFLSLPICRALFEATLVLGTVGYPTSRGPAQFIIVIQIFSDLMIILLLLSVFASRIGLFRRKDEESTE